MEGDERQDTTQSWLDRLGKGDAAAWLRFIRERLPTIRSTVRRYLRTEEDTDDVVQEVIVKVLVSSRNFRLDPTLNGGFWGWCIVVARNAAIAELRKKGRMEEDRAGCLNELPQAQVLTEEQIERLLGAALDKLEEEISPKAYAVYRGKILDGKKRGEVAADLGLDLCQEDQLKCMAHKRMKVILGELIAEWPWSSPGADDEGGKGGGR